MIADRVQAGGLDSPAEQQRRSGGVLHTSQFPPARLRATEVVNPPPHVSPDDFGIFRCMPLVFASGLMFWAAVLLWLL